MGLKILQKDAMSNDSGPQHDNERGGDRADRDAGDGNPKFGRLLLVLLAAVVFCAALTWVMGAFFPNFPNF